MGNYVQNIKEEKLTYNAIRCKVKFNETEHREHNQNRHMEVDMLSAMIDKTSLLVDE